MREGKEEVKRKGDEGKGKEERRKKGGGREGEGQR